MAGTPLPLLHSIACSTLLRGSTETSRIGTPAARLTCATCLVTPGSTATSVIGILTMCVTWAECLGRRHSTMGQLLTILLTHCPPMEINGMFLTSRTWIRFLQTMFSTRTSATGMCRKLDLSTGRLHQIITLINSSQTGRLLQLAISNTCSTMTTSTTRVNRWCHQQVAGTYLVR